MVTMFGWLSADAARASCSKRRTRSASPVNCGGQQLEGDLAAEPRVVGQVHLTHAARGQHVHDLVVADDLPGHRPRLPLGEHCGGDVRGGRLDEALRLLVRREERLDLVAERLVASAGPVEEGGALRGFMLQRRVK